MKGPSIVPRVRRLRWLGEGRDEGETLRRAVLKCEWLIATRLVGQDRRGASV